MIDRKPGMEELDDKVVKRLKEVQDIQLTTADNILAFMLSGLNTSPSPKLMKFGLKGRTVVNLLGSFGDCEKVAFSYSGATAVLDATNKVFGSNCLKLTGADAQGWCLYGYYITSFYDKTKYYCLSVYAKNETTTGIYVRITDGTAVVKTETYTEIGKYKRLFVKINANAMTAASLSAEVVVTGNSTQIAFIDGLMINEITAAEYNDPNYTPPEYTNTNVSVSTPVVKSLGKNLIYNGDAENWLDGYILGNISVGASGYIDLSPGAKPTNFKIDNGYFSCDMTTGADVLTKPVRVIPGKTYTFSCEKADTKETTIFAYFMRNLQSFTDGVINQIGGNLYETNVSNNASSVAGKQTFTFTVPVGFNYVMISPMWSNVTQTVKIRKLQLEEGAVATAYESYKETVINFPYTLRECNTTVDEITQDGNFIQRVEYSILNGSLAWQPETSYTGFKRVIVTNYLSATGFVTDEYRCLKFNNKFLGVASTSAGGDRVGISGGHLYITIPGSDSGWGDSYTPTADEIKAYFNGWKMYDGVNNPSGDGVYNRTDNTNKYWCRRTIGTTYADSTNVLPTTVATDFTPYRLYYKLGKPVINKIITNLLSVYVNGAVTMESVIKPIFNYSISSNVQSNIDELLSLSSNQFIRALTGENGSGTTTVSSMDNINKSGFYTTKDAMTIDGITDWWFVIHVENTVGTSYSYQIASPLQTSGKQYIRNKILGTWSAFTRILTKADYDSLAENSSGGIIKDASLAAFSGTKKADALTWGGQCVYKASSTSASQAITSIIINNLRFGNHALVVRMKSANNAIATNAIQVVISKNVGGVMTTVTSLDIAPNEFSDTTNYKEFFIPFEYTGAKATNNEFQISIATLTASASFEVAVDCIKIFPATVAAFS